MQIQFFQQLTHDLKQHGTGTPQLIVDMATFEHNLNIVRQYLPCQLQPRLVVKSLACIELLKNACSVLKTQRFMVFHQPHLSMILQHFPDADILLGKPMPIRAMSDFYQQYPHYRNANIQWLIDGQARLQQYLSYAEQQSVCLSLNIEIDVGLHRGGIATDAQFRQCLDRIAQYPQQLKFSGLMGYDAHVSKVPQIIQSTAQSYQQSQKMYQHYQDIIRQDYPQLWQNDLCFNGGGSPSFRLHCEKTVCNDLAFGSMLLKPSTFDSEFLKQFQCALWIATPVLKVLDYAQLPALDILNKLPHRDQAAFVYGGYWLADYVYPKNSRPHSLYGRSSNQEMVQIPKATRIAMDDYIFLRPQQSEAILPQFAQLYAYRQGGFCAWQTFRE
ncbi:MAG: alanine racemase [Bacteroidia bacterium]|jgi:D-serine deaminase-like pyridoxal phosphate-dependent protein|nr:MAG: alanine racemase [Bacteroidia bacterium]